MKKFKVVDVYDSRETIGYASNMTEVKKLARERIEDTDGECLIEIRKLDKEINKYKFSSILKFV